MTVLERSSTAQDHYLGEWYHQIEMGHVKLPRFNATRRGTVVESLVFSIP